MSRLIAIDPGKTTGVAIVTSNNRIERLAQYTGVSWIDEIGLQIDDVVIFENYFIKNLAFDTSGIEVIGAIKYVCEKHKIKYVVQEPSVPGFINTRFNLKGVRFNCGIHAKEALFHAVYYRRASMNREDIINGVKAYTSYRDKSVSRLSKKVGLTV